jgi:hypothetical protein
MEACLDPEGTRGDSDLNTDIGQVVMSVRDLGEKARFLAVNLAVATAKLKQMQGGAARHSGDLLELVAKVSRVAHDVSDVVTTIDMGFSEAKPQSQYLWMAAETTGVPDDRTLDRLSQSLNDTLDLARQVLGWARRLGPPPGDNVAEPGESRRHPVDDLHDDSI